jgi:hypothetical protein
MRSYPRHLVTILRDPPNPLAGLKWMTFQAGRIQGKVYLKMIMVNVYGKPGKHGRLEDLGSAGPGWHWSGYRA